MADIEVQFLNRNTSRRQRGRIDDSMTGQEVVDELVEAGFIRRSTAGYELWLKGSNLLNRDQDLRSAGVRENAVLEVAPIMEAGRFSDPTER